MDTNSDRTVHAVLGDGGQIARYDRSGKYYLEYPPEAGKKRRAIQVAEAVDLAVNPDSRPFARIRWGLAGGQSFDAKARKARSALALKESQETK